MEACVDALTENGLMIVQTTEDNNQDAVTTVTHIVHAASGQWLRGRATVPCAKSAHGVGSAMTYGRRYGLVSLLGIVADEDDDGNAAMPAPSMRRS